VAVAGAIVNKVDLVAQPDLPTYLERGLGRHGISLLGVLPYQPILSNPTLAMVLEGVRGETLHPGPSLDLVIDSVAIGAMQPHHMLQRVGPGSLVIVPGDREDAILALTTAHLVGRARSASPLEAAGLEGPDHDDAETEGAAVGLVLTGGYRPREAVVAAIRGANLFATLVGEDTYTVASEVHDLLVKTHDADTGKIALIKELVAGHLDIDRILDVATVAGDARVTR
jgi:BioD-like phosphotransacetylase family protein